MVLLQFQIFFDNPTAIYFGGQIVSGKVLVTVNTSKRIRGIELRFRGEANVQWHVQKTERNTANNTTETSTVTFSANELYFENRMFILGGPNGEMLLQPGDHMYAFSMQLPTILPSSFEGRYGHVRYTLRATIDRPWKFNHNAKVAFTVLSHLDLNADLALQMPRQVVNEKYLCCCCCKSGPISLVVNLPATGFTPGQEIPLVIEVDNNTSDILPSVKCSLLKTVTFIAVRPTRDKRVDKLVAAKLELGSVRANDSNTWTERMRVPSLPPSFLNHCNIIQVDYSLEVEVRISGPHHNLIASVPLVLGTIPLLSPVPRQPLQLGIGPPVQSYCNPTAPPPPPPPPLDGEPPSYEECTFGPSNITDGEDNQYTHGNLGFTPRYLIYN